MLGQQKQKLAEQIARKGKSRMRVELKQKACRANGKTIDKKVIGKNHERILTIFKPSRYKSVPILQWIPQPLLGLLHDDVLIKIHMGTILCQFLICDDSEFPLQGHPRLSWVHHCDHLHMRPDGINDIKAHGRANEAKQS